MKQPGNGPYAAGYLGKQDGPLSITPPLTTEKGDAKLELLLKGRTFANAPVRPLGGRVARPEPLGVPGGCSSLSLNPGTAGGARRAHCARDYIR